MLKLLRRCLPLLVTASAVIADASVVNSWRDLFSRAKQFTLGQDADSAAFYGRRALEACTDSNGVDDSTTISVMLWLSEQLYTDGRIEEGADVRNRATGSIQRQMRDIQDSLGDTALELVPLLTLLARTYEHYPISRYAVACSLYQRAYDICVRDEKPDDIVTSNLQLLLCADLIMARKYDDAETLLTEFVDRGRSSLRTDKSQLIRALWLLARLRSETSKTAAADSLYISAAERARSIDQQTDSMLVDVLLEHAERLYRPLNQITNYFRNYDEAIAVIHGTRSPSTPELLAPLTEAALMCRRLGKYAEAERYHQRALDVAASAYGRGSATAGWYLYNLGYCYMEHGELAAAESILVEALKAFSSTTYGSQKSALRISLALASVQEKMGAIEKSDSTREAIDAMADTLFLGSDPRYVDSVKEHIDTLMARRDYLSAEPVISNLLMRLETAGGDNVYEMPQLLAHLGTVCSSQSRYREAESASRRALFIAEERGYSFNIGFYLGNLAFYCWKNNKLAEAYLLQKRRLAILDKKSKPTEAIIDALTSLAVLSSDLGKCYEGERLARRAISMLEMDSVVDSTALMAEAFNTLGRAYIDMCRYPDAIFQFDTARAMYVERNGYECLGTANAIMNTGLAYFYQGNLPQAQANWEESLDLYKKLFPPNSDRIAIILTNLGNLYKAQGNESRAIQYYKDAIAIYDRVDSSRTVGTFAYNNLADVLLGNREYARARKMYERKLAFDRAGQGRNAPSAVADIISIAECYRLERNYVVADSLLRRAREIITATQGDSARQMAWCNHSLALNYLGQKKYAEAASLLDNALQRYQYFYGPENRTATRLMLTLSAYYATQHEMDTSYALAMKAYNILNRKFYENGILGLSELDLLSYSHSLQWATHTLISAYLENSTDDRFGESIADVILNAKGLVLNQIIDRRRSASRTADSLEMDLIDSLRSVKGRSYDLFMRGPATSPDSYVRMRDSLLALLSDLESRLVRLSAKQNRIGVSRRINTHQVMQYLPGNSVLAEFTKYRDQIWRGDTGDVKYCVAIIDNQGLREIINIGSARVVDDLVQQYREHMDIISRSRHYPSTSDKAKYTEIGRGLYNLVVRPAEKYLGNKELLVLSTDGALSLISFAGLIDSAGRYLVERIPIHYVTSSSDLIPRADESSSNAELIAFGDPDFDDLPSDSASDAKSDALAHTNVNRNIRASCDDFQDMKVDRLPYSQREVRSILQYWNDSCKLPGEAHLGVDASEENFKSRAPGKAVIHLATHGFYLGGRCAKGSGETDLSDTGRFAGEHPLLLSGLLLAGANRHAVQADHTDREDGILTAYEIADMNLQGTEVVALSACESGIGKIEDADGVYGLRRAFQLAGAKTIISSLWSVSDSITAFTMPRIYRHSGDRLPWLMQEMEISQIERLRRLGLNDHPWSWSAFITIGEWRSLSESSRN